MVSITFIIGLPGSGKTSYASLNMKNDKSTIFDDFITLFATGEITRILKDKSTKISNVVLIDPRLCKVTEFIKFYSYVKQFVTIESIYVIFFENDPQKCVFNKPNLKTTIMDFSEKYMITDIIQYLENDNYIILPCYANC